MKRLLVAALLGALVVLVYFSIQLAMHRIYQVDECGNVYAARMLATGQAKGGLGVDLLQLLLSRVMRGATSAGELFASARCIMLEIFWLNIVLIAVATGERLFSLGGLAALAGAATLAPLWDYGIEARHDNLVLTGVLLMWCALRVRPAGWQSYFAAGAIAVMLQFAAFKAFVYTIPLALGFLAFPPPGHKTARWKLAASEALGAVGMFLLMYVVYRAAGIWGGYTQGVRGASQLTVGGVLHRFGPGLALERLLHQTPLLLALVASALAAMAVELCRRGKAALNWDGCLPEIYLLLISLAALCINPNPYPYNLVNVVPFAYLLAFRHGAEFLRAQPNWPAALVPIVGGLIVFAHAVPFGQATRRHWDRPNTRQEILMLRAEQETDPAKDPVFDGIGMVPTRRAIDERAFLHGQNMEAYLKGSGPQVRDLLAEHPAAVFIPNYRTDWLPEADHAFMRERYVALADDFWVLGKVLPAGGGSFEIVHPGRYRIATLQASDLAGTYTQDLKGMLARPEEGKVAGRLDGAALTDQVVEFATGAHRLECEADCQPTVVWVGPRLKRPEKLNQADHQFLFANWY